MKAETPDVLPNWVDEAVEAWHQASVEARGMPLDDALSCVLARVAPLIADHALRTATLQQHEEMIGRIAAEAIERERPKLLAMMREQAEVALAERLARMVREGFKNG